MPIHIKLNTNLVKLLFLVLPIMILFSIIVFKDYIFFYISTKLPACVYYNKLNIFCPACGNTRCILSLLKGNILLAIKYNITPILIGIILILLYIELGTYIFFKHKKILPRNGVFWTIFIIIMILYYVLRNIFPFLAP